MEHHADSFETFQQAQKKENWPYNHDGGIEEEFGEEWVALG